MQKFFAWSHVDVPFCQSAPRFISNSRFFSSLATFVRLSQVEFANPGGLTRLRAVGGGLWVVGAVPVSAWPWLFPSSSFFPPTWTGQAGPAGIPTRSQENAEALALALGFSKVPSQERGWEWQSGVEMEGSANPRSSRYQESTFFKKKDKQTPLSAGQG